MRDERAGGAVRHENHVVVRTRHREVERVDPILAPRPIPVGLHDSATARVHPFPMALPVIGSGIGETGQDERDQMLILRAKGTAICKLFKLSSDFHYDCAWNGAMPRQPMHEATMSDVGIFRTNASIENPLRPGDFRELTDVMVDTGSEYTWIPRAVLASLGIEPKRTARFATADGRVLERLVAFANVYAGGTSAPDIVVFADDGDMTLLGARALEGLNLRVDLVSRTLVPAGLVPVASAA
jgi:predicted aspartyl protease